MKSLYALCFFQVAMFNLWQVFPEADQWHVYDISLRIIIASGLLFVAIKPTKYGVMALCLHLLFLMKDIADVVVCSDVHSPVPELLLYGGAMTIPFVMHVRDKRKGRP